MVVFLRKVDELDLLQGGDVSNARMYRFTLSAPTTIAQRRSVRRRSTSQYCVVHHQTETKVIEADSFAIAVVGMLLNSRCSRASYAFSLVHDQYLGSLAVFVLFVRPIGGRLQDESSGKTLRYLDAVHSRKRTGPTSIITMESDP